MTITTTTTTTTSHRKSPVQKPCTLTPINLHNPPEYTELQHQRQKCGWDSEDSSLLAWRAKQDANLKSFFWITIPSPTDPDSCIRAGHISLDAYAEPPDLELANPDRSVLTIQTFFILPEYRGGLGRRAMDLVEALAAQEPRCKYVTLNALSKKYFYEESWFWDKLERERPSVCAVEWYERRGYVWWKSEPRYREPRLYGGEVIVWADFLRKPLLG
jgi:hypothetical protein